MCPSTILLIQRKERMNDGAQLHVSITNGLQSIGTEHIRVSRELKYRTKEVIRETLQRQRNGKIKDTL